MPPMTNAPKVSENTQHTEFRLIVGAADWRHPRWVGDYYPEDLPPEWRLAFYANDFTGVLLAEARWRGAAEAAWAHWREEAPAGFRFLLGMEEDAADRSAERCAQLLGPAFGGWVSRSPPPGSPALRAAPLALALEEDAPVVLLTAEDLVDKRRLGRRLLALAHRPAPVTALIGEGAIGGEALKEVRLIAELAGLG